MWYNIFVRALSIFLNILIRLSIIYFLAEVLLNPLDPRFTGKAIPIRNLIIVISLSLAFPILQLLKKRWSFDKAHNYPFWLDNLYLSIFWLDMAGNSFNLYDSFFYFDLIPHFYGTGAIAVVFAAMGASFASSVGLANVIHMVLEAQEFYTDVFFKTHNVRGLFDTVNDLTVGLVATIIYAGLYLLWRKKAKSQFLS